MPKTKSQLSKRTSKSRTAKIYRIGEFSSEYTNHLASLREYTLQASNVRRSLRRIILHPRIETKTTSKLKKKTNNFLKNTVEAG